MRGGVRLRVDSQSGAIIVFMFRFKKKERTEKPDMKELVRVSGLSHIAFIMDGNGRWATKRSLPREAGHSAGAKNFKSVVRYCKSIGIRYVTVYAFSTENWKRPKHEVDAIMNLLDGYMEEARREPDVEYKFIGDMAPIPEGIRTKINALEEMTRGREYRLNIALNYGGRAEIVNAANKAFAHGVTELTDTDIETYLYTGGCPDPDLVVRTGGEYRISNFLMWQSAYSELFFSDKLWPEYSSDDVDEAVISFSKRKRRFGGLDKK